jgi:hypothetical protein
MTEARDTRRFAVRKEKSGFHACIDRAPLRTRNDLFLRHFSVTFASSCHHRADTLRIAG